MTIQATGPTVRLGESTFTKVLHQRDYGYQIMRATWVCDVCGRRGKGTDEHPFEWSLSCGRGHLPCDYCGKQLAVLMDGTVRFHTRCPDGKDAP